MMILKGPGIPRIISYIEEGDYNIMIMELLGKSLEGLLKQSPGKKMSIKTVCLLGIEMLKILKCIHDKNYIHRDIKPDNFAIGYSEPNNLFLLDFGLAKKYRSSRTLEQKPMQKNKKLTGTARYASINALRGYDQSRRDDLESVGYVLAYLLRGNLPWQGIIVKTKEEKYAKILYKKQYITPEELLNGYPTELVTYIKYCKGLDYNEEPDYNYLTGLFSNVIKNHLKEEIDFKYDWIKNDIDLNKSIRENYITDEGINNSYLNNTSMVNNMNNSTSILNNNSNIIYENEHKINKINNINNINNINKETNYYDTIMEEENLKKNDNFDNENNEDENSPKNGKKKHAPCCILY
jgi:serine/threonine protein kinase